MQIADSLFAAYVYMPYLNNDIILLAVVLHTVKGYKMSICTRWILGALYIYFK